MSMFDIIVADPPWSFGDKLPGPSRGAAKNYDVMTQGDIEDYLRPGFGLPAEYLIANDALLFLWRVASQVEEAVRVARAWGFVPKSEIVWVKTSPKLARHVGETIDWRTGENLHFGMGRYARMAHEGCMIAARGKAIQLIASRSVRSVFFAPTGKHSEKPDAFFEMIERLTVAHHGRLELFARKRRPGWICLGNELPE